MGSTIEQVRLAFISVPRTNLLEPLHHPHQLRGAIDHRHINNLTLTGPRGLQKPTHDTSHQQHPTTTKVANQIQRNDRTLATPADRMKSACDGDVIQIMASSLCQGTCLPPTCHARKHQSGVPRQTLFRTESQFLADTGTVWVD